MLFGIAGTKDFFFLENVTILACKCINFLLEKSGVIKSWEYYGYKDNNTLLANA